ARRGLAGVVDPGVRARDGVHVLPRRGGDAGGALEEVERGALAAEEGDDGCLGFGDEVAGLDGITVSFSCLERARRVTCFECRLRERQPGQSAGGLTEEAG